MQHDAELDSFILHTSHFIPRKIAVFRALYLGDFLCATPAFRALRQRFSQAEITLIGLPWAREFAERLPYIDRMIEFVGYAGIAEVPYNQARTRAFLEAAREEGYDLAFQMHGSGVVSNGFVADLGAKVSIGYRHGHDNRLTYSLPYPEDEHEITRWLKLVRLQIDPVAQSACKQSRMTEFPLTDADRASANHLLAETSERPLIALHTGAKDPARRWPTEKFATLGDALVEQFGAQIVLTGSAGERDLTGAVRDHMRHPVIDLAGASDLGTFAAVIERLDLLVTNDTGASHIAAATQTPSVVLFGPTRPDNWAPFDRARHHVLDALDYAAPEATPAQALRDLPVAAVLAHCNALIGTTQSLREAVISV